MIEFKNNGKVVTVEYDEKQKSHIIKTAKKLTLQPKERFEIDTKLTVHCSHQLDECVITELVRDDLDVYFISDKYSNSNPEQEIKLIGFYNGGEVAVLEKGESIACASCYHLCDEKESDTFLSLEDADKPYVYTDDNIRVQSLTGAPIHIETVLESDGTKYIKIPLEERAENVQQ